MSDEKEYFFNKLKLVIDAIKKPEFNFKDWIEILKLKIKILFIYIRSFFKHKFRLILDVIS